MRPAPRKRIAVPQWDDAPYYVFKPQGREPVKGFIFYGGSQVDPRGYAPAAHAIAGQGFLMVLVAMPRDTALLAPERAEVVIQAFPDVDLWAVGGHSMGGIAACQFARDNLDLIDAVILWASQPTEQNRIDATELEALSIFASNDGIYTPEVIEQSRQHLPADTVWVDIQGGNHYQFGYYQNDHKPFDGDAQISREQQQAQIIAATTAFLEQL